jgi:hypothetical protein
MIPTNTAASQPNMPAFEDDEIRAPVDSALWRTSIRSLRLASNRFHRTASQVSVFNFTSTPLTHRQVQKSSEYNIRKPKLIPVRTIQQ